MRKEHGGSPEFQCPDHFNSEKEEKSCCLAVIGWAQHTAFTLALVVPPSTPAKAGAWLPHLCLPLYLPITGGDALLLE